MAEAATRFVVKRLRWAEQYGGKRTRQPGEVAVMSFPTFEEAEAERAKREEEARKSVNPFDCGPAVHYWSHLDEPRLRDWLMDHGITPPEPKKDGSTNWSDWWKKNQKKLGPEKRAAVWEILDKVRFFAVREEPVRPVGYAVIQVNWEYNDEYYDADPEGGRLVQVYRVREQAEAVCARRNKEARKEWSFVDDMVGDVEDEEFEFDDDDEFFGAAFDMQNRLIHRRGLWGSQKLKKGEGRYHNTNGVPFFEVIEVELEGLE